MVALRPSLLSPHPAVVGSSGCCGQSRAQDIHKPSLTGAGQACLAPGAGLSWAQEDSIPFPPQQCVCLPPRQDAAPTDKSVPAQAPGGAGGGCGGEDR